VREERERERASEREREREERTLARGSKRSEREREDTRARKRERERERESTSESENERREHLREGARGRAREGPRKRRRGRASPAQQQQRWGLRWAWTGAPARHRRTSEDRGGGCTCSAVTRRDGAGEPLPAPALFAEAPDRRLAKGGGMREFTDKIFHCSRKRTDAFQEDGANFFSVLEPSAPTTLTSWGRHRITDAGLGGAQVGWPRGLWGAQSGSGVDGWQGTFATPILDILGATSSADAHHRAVRRGVYC